MPKTKNQDSQRPMESYEHRDKQRVNNPPVGLVNPDTDPAVGVKKVYAYDPHLDPHLEWAGKAEHMSFEVLYVHRGVERKYRPDFLVRLAGGDMLVLETKGQDSEQDQVKRRYLEEWTTAVTAYGGFGRWRAAVVWRPGEIRDVLIEKAGEKSRR